jgi:hypothetical protein
MHDVDDVVTEQVPSELLAAVERAKGSDPLAPVTVVTSSGYAAVFVRRALAFGTGIDARRGRRGTANVKAITAGELVRSLGVPLLGSRGLRPASRAIETETLRTEASAAGGWLGHYAGHRRALDAVGRALGELRYCPPAVLDSIGARDPHAGALVTLLRAVRTRLHAHGFADDTDVACAALNAVRAGGDATKGLGPLFTWHLGRRPRDEMEVLSHLGARRIDEGPAGRSRPCPLCEVRPCADVDEESRAAVRAVIEKAEAGVALWRQAIFHPPGTGYARLLHQHLASAGVATNGPGVRRLDRSAAARTLLGFLELAGGDWSRDRVSMWLATAPVVTGRRGRPVPASRWSSLSASAGVIRGAAQWSERLARHAADHESDASEAEAMSEFVSGLVSRAAARGRTWAEHARWAADVLEEYLDPGVGNGLWPADEIAAYEQVRGVVRSLGDLDHVSAGTDPDSFRRALETVLEQTELDTGESGIGTFGDGVFVSPFGMARGLRFHQVVACGLADAVVPGPGAAEPLLGEEIRLSDTSGTLRTRTARRDELHDDLLCAIGAGTVHRSATFPRCDPRSGRLYSPSRWLPALAPPGTPWAPVDSFAAGITGGGPSVSLRELELRVLERWVSCGGDASLSPVARADPRLAAAYEAVAARAGPNFTRFDGWVGTGAVSPFDPAAPVSATRFETYARCPRRFMFERTLRVSKRVLPEELWRIQPATRGSLVHEILEAYVAERISGASRSLERLLVVAGEHLDKAAAGGLVGKRLLWRIERATILRELRRFHAEEGDLRPLSVEFCFDTEGADAPPVKIDLENGQAIRFRGSADRVDRTPSGHLVVSDYKTGKQSGLGDLMHDPVAAGTLLQLPLYGMAAGARFGAGSTGQVHARYWLLSSERSAPCYHLVVTEQVQERFRRVVGEIAGAIAAGCFPGIPGAPVWEGHFKNCRVCDFDELCPVDRERQWNRKLSDPKLRSVSELLHDEAPGSLGGAVVKGFVDPDRGSR